MHGTGDGNASAAVGAAACGAWRVCSSVEFSTAAGSVAVLVKQGPDMVRELRPHTTRPVIISIIIHAIRMIRMCARISHSYTRLIPVLGIV